MNINVFNLELNVLKVGASLRYSGRNVKVNHLTVGLLEKRNACLSCMPQTDSHMHRGSAFSLTVQPAERWQDNSVGGEQYIL